MKEYFFYILECSDRSYYTGITNDLARRLCEHNEGRNHTCYTFRKRPVTLKFYCRFMDPRQAIAFEKQLKDWSRKKKKALIDENIDLLHQLAECKNKSHYLNNSGQCFYDDPHDKSE